MIIRILICLVIGGVSGWFVKSEWEKHHPKQLVIVEAWKPIITKDDIRIVDWRGKK